VAFFQHGNARSCSIKGGKFLERLSDYNLKKQYKEIVSNQQGQKTSFHFRKTRVCRQEGGFDSPHTLHEKLLDASPASVITLLPVPPTPAHRSSSNGL
jgi:hypothetical protein